jgi:DNA-binding NarL/FixJ family response regulator
MIHVVPIDDGVVGARMQATEAMRLPTPGMPPPSGLMRDLVRALWQAGQLDRALELVDQRGLARAGLDLRGRAQVHLDLAWGCLDSGRVEQARVQLAKARSLVVGTDVELLRLHCEVIAARLATEAADPAAEPQARATAEAAERLVNRATEAGEQRTAAEVACRAWGVLVSILRQDRYQDSCRLRRRIVALAERHNLPGWALYERQAVAVEQCWADGDDLPIRVLQTEAQRLGHINLALHLQSSRWTHEVLVSPGSLSPTVAGLVACAEQARKLGIARVQHDAVAGLLLAAGLRADHHAWAETLARFEVASSISLEEPAVAARACWLALEGRDGEALATLQDLVRKATGPGHNPVGLGLLLLLGTLAGTTSQEQVTQAMAGSGRSRWTRLFLHWAAAVHAGRSGDRDEAERHAALAAQAAAIYPVARHLAARLVAPAAATDGWGSPISDLRAAETWFHDQGVPVTARTCRDLLRALGAPIRQRRNGTDAIPAELRYAGITAREYEVGLLVREHLCNRDIGERLHISIRTVEKHMAALLTKLAVPNRSGVITRMAEETLTGRSM